MMQRFFLCRLQFQSRFDINIKIVLSMSCQMCPHRFLFDHPLLIKKSHKMIHDINAMRLIFIKQISWQSASNIMTSHYSDGIMSPRASQIAGVSMAYSTVSSGADQRKHQSSASLAFVRGIRRWPVNSPHKRSVTRKMFPFGDAIMNLMILGSLDSTESYCLGCHEGK